jgi:hypothetical protein
MAKGSPNKGERQPYEKSKGEWMSQREPDDLKTPQQF